MVTLISQKSGRNRLASVAESDRKMIEMIWGAYQSVLNKEGRVAYASMVISSGRRLYDVLDKYGVKTKAELAKVNSDAAFKEVIEPNIVEVKALADALAKRIDVPVVAPCYFEQSPNLGWGQDDYMSMWFGFLSRCASWLYMLPGWSYSNGGTEEYCHCVEMALGFHDRSDMEVMDYDGNPLPVSSGLSELADALCDLDARGHRAPIIANVFEHVYGLYRACASLSDEEKSARNWNRCYWDLTDPQAAEEAARRVAPTLASYGISLVDAQSANDDDYADEDEAQAGS